MRLSSNRAPRRKLAKPITDDVKGPDPESVVKLAPVVAVISRGSVR